MKKTKRILMVVGGTGGHIYPALALASEMKKRKKLPEISFVTDGRPLAATIIGNEGYFSNKIIAAPLPRKKFWHICCFIFKLIFGFFQSLFLIKKKKPDLVLAFGSYISVPVVLAATLLRIPVILHEQNYFPGMANRFLSFCAEKIALTFKTSSEYFPPRKTVITGNPVREEILKTSRDEGIKKLKLDPDRITILVFGGSQGAADINYSIMGVLPYLEGMKGGLQFVHVCGQKKNEGISEKYREAGIKARIFKYLNKIAYAYSVADIIVCRAGATTIAEIVSKGIPAIFIPYPYATSQHQELNTIPLCERGGAISLPSGEISGESLALKLIPLIKDYEKRRRMQIEIKAFQEKFINGAGRLADLVQKYV